MELEEVKNRIVALETELRNFDAEKATDEEATAILAKTDELESARQELSQIEAAAKLEAANKRIAALLNDQNTSTGSNDIVAADTGRFKIPAKARPRRSLKAFANNEESLRAAYLFGHSFAANICNSKSSQRWLRDHGIVDTALTGGDDSKGGLFVPIETETAIIRLVEEFGVFRRFADVTPMSSDTKIKNVRVGGMTAYPVGETNAANEGSNKGTRTSPTYKPVELVARKWKTLIRITEELDEDSLINLADQVALESAQAFAIAEDNSGFNGTGTSAFHGIKGLKSALKAGSTLDTANGELAFSDLTLAHFQEAVGAVPEYPGIQSAWYISKAGYYASMARLLDAAGGNTNSDIALGAPMQFMGYPVVISQSLPTSLEDQASTFLCYFGDLQMAAVFGDRRGMTMRVSEEYAFEEDQISIKATERMDIKIHSPGTATSAGPIVGIKTAAA